MVYVEDFHTISFISEHLNIYLILSVFADTLCNFHNKVISLIVLKQMLFVFSLCGPATTVDVYCVSAPYLDIRPEKDRVFEKTKGMGRFVLYPQQIYLLNTSQPRVFLSGPPGTGKTMTLILQGLKWLQHGNDVHVVSLWPFSRLVNRVIEHQLGNTFTMWSTGLTSGVILHEFDLREEDNIDAMIAEIESAGSGRPLRILVDEAMHDYTYK